jgi:hypothetical protein
MIGAQIQAQRLGEHGVVGDGKAFQIPQALAAAKDSQDGHQQQVPGRDANAPSNARVRDRLEVANQIEIGCGRDGLGQRVEATPPASNHADSSCKRTWNRL